MRESKSNGLIERAVRNWRDQYRTLRHQIERRMKEPLPKNGALSSWLVTWAADVINKYRIQANGRTAFEMMTQHRCKHLSIGFGEKVFFQHTQAGKDEYRKEVGVFLGVNDRCQTYLVGTSDGIYASSNAVRVGDEEAYDMILLKDITVKYYSYISEGVSPPPCVVIARSHTAARNPDLEPVVSANGGYVPRRLQIKLQYLQNHGFTAGCPGCIGAQGGRRGPHTEACRIRLEGLIDDGRKTRVEDRLQKYVTEQVEDGDVGNKKDEQNKDVVPERGQGESAVSPPDMPEKSSSAVVPPNAVAESAGASPSRKGPMQVPSWADVDLEPMDTEELHEIVGNNVDLEDGPAAKSEGRCQTPERKPASKRPDRERQDQARNKRRVGVDVTAIDNDGDMDDGVELLSPSMGWYHSNDEGMPVDSGATSSREPMATAAADHAGTSADVSMDLLDEDDRRILASVILNVDVTEVFSPERNNKLARKFGLTPGASMDLTNGYDFNKPEDRRRAWSEIKKTEPFIIIGSPPCTLFSNLQELNKHIHRDDPAWLSRFESEKQKAIGHLQFCALLYRHQLRQGRHFLHEHPWGASSWKLDFMNDLVNDPRVFSVETHMCRFGMTSHVRERDGPRGLVKKPTGFITSSRCVAAQLNVQCDGSHLHVHLVGGRASAAQVYPDELCRAILRGVVRQKAADNKIASIAVPIVSSSQIRGFISSLSGVDIGSVREFADATKPSGSWPANWIDKMHEPDGGMDTLGPRPQHGIDLLKSELDALTMRNGIACAKDDVSGAELLPEQVVQARKDEMSYFHKLGVYEIVPRSQQRITGGKVVSTRWIDVNKGDSLNPNYRSRLVGREFNVERDDSLYAATPPLEALRLILSNAATWTNGHSKGRRQVMINDVRRAYFYAKVSRDIYIEVPTEDPDAGPNVLGKLKLCLYGTRDAAKSWQETLSAQLISIGFTRGVGYPSVFHHAKRDILTLVHGDDYFSSGMQNDLDWLEGELASAYEIQTQKIGAGSGCEREGKVLNRVVRYTDQGWQLEADPRHAELVIEQLGVGGSRSVVTPGVDDDDDETVEVDIEGADATRFRGVAARCNYLAFDRPDLQYATKEVCREMSKPTTGSLRRLTRIAQYLRGKPRLVWEYAMQMPCDVLDIFTDSNWAGCHRTRKSTSGGVVMLGEHCIKSWSKTQSVVAKSSAEAELYAVVRGATEGLGMLALMADLGRKSRLALHLDATAAKSIVERKGLSKVRHVDVNVLWLQETCARKLIPLHKVPGEDNCSDMMTKHLVSNKLDKNLATMRIEITKGRSDKAAKLHSLDFPAAPEYDSIRQKLDKQRGGDRWLSRNDNGVWQRLHVTPRSCLFTPFRIAKGPTQGTQLSSIRFTKGITRSGRRFEFHDRWNKAERRHLQIDEDWIGTTVFVDANTELHDGWLSSNLEVI